MLNTLKRDGYKFISPLALIFEHSPFCPRGVICMFLTSDSSYLPEHQ
jgi:hypothetical protein